MSRRRVVLTGIAISGVLLSSCMSVNRENPVTSFPGQTHDTLRKMQIAQAAPLREHPSLSPCSLVTWSADRSTMHFIAEGKGIGGEHDGPDEVLRIARDMALSRALRCSGERRIISSFFDDTYRIGGHEGQVIDREIFETLESQSSYEVTSRSCQIAEKNLLCRVTLRGTMQVVRHDPTFRIRTEGFGIKVYKTGEVMRARFRLTKPANVYLFDVDENGQAALLFPNALLDVPKNPLPAGKCIVYPPEGIQGIRLVASLPPGRKRTLEHLWVIALRDFELMAPGEIGKIRSERGDLLMVGNFRKNILGRLYRMNIPGRMWTMREIPFEIVENPHPGFRRTNINRGERP